MITGAVVVLVGLVVLMLVTALPDKKEPSLGEGRSEAILTSSNKAGDTVVKYPVDNYEITVDGSWKVPQYVLTSGDLVLGFAQDEDLQLSILLLDNPRELPPQSWLKETQQSNSFFTKLSFHEIYGRLYRAEGELYRDDFDQAGNPAEVAVEGSVTVAYLVFEGEKVYLISCGAVGEGAMELIDSCENTTFTFKTEREVSGDTGRSSIMQRYVDLVASNPLIKELPHSSEDFEISYAVAGEETTKVSYEIIIDTPSGLTVSEERGWVARSRKAAEEWVKDKGFNINNFDINWIIN